MTKKQLKKCLELCRKLCNYLTLNRDRFWVYFIPGMLGLSTSTYPFWWFKVTP